MQNTPKREHMHKSVSLTHTFKTIFQGKNGAIWVKDILCHWGLKFEDKLILAW